MLHGVCREALRCVEAPSVQIQDADVSTITDCTSVLSFVTSHTTSAPVAPSGGNGGVPSRAGVKVVHSAAADGDECGDGARGYRAGDERGREDDTSSDDDEENDGEDEDGDDADDADVGEAGDSDAGDGGEMCSSRTPERRLHASVESFVGAHIYIMT